MFRPMRGHLQVHNWHFTYIEEVFFISNFCRVLHVACFLWVIPRRLTPGNYPKENIQHVEEKLHIFSQCLFNHCAVNNTTARNS